MSKEKKRLSAGLTILALIGSATGLVCAVYWWNTPILPALGSNFTVGPGCVLAVVAYTYLSLHQIDTDRHGGIYFFGMPLIRVSSGLKYAPAFLTQVRTVSAHMQEFQFPADPELVYRGSDKDELPSITIDEKPQQMVRPIRMVTRAPTNKETGHLDVQMTLVVNFVVQFQITDIFDFITNFGDIPYLARQLRDVGEATLAEDITKRTAGKVVTELPAINLHLFSEIQARLQKAGVQIRSARMLSPDITHEVSTAFANVPIKRAEAEQTRISAAAERDKRTEEGVGTANARRALLTAEALGRKQMMDELSVSGETVVASETARDGLKEADVIVVGAEGLKDAMGFVKAAQSAMKPAQTKS